MDDSRCNFFSRKFLLLKLFLDTEPPLLCYGKYTTIGCFIKVLVTILFPGLLSDRRFEHLEGVEGTSNKRAGGHFKTHLFAYRFILLKFLRRDKSNDR